MSERNGRIYFRKHIRKTFAGFTLVELIVVITILAILGATVFVSLSGYSRGARDSSRISTMSSVLKGLNISRQRVGKYPVPDSPRISLMNTGVTFGYQGYAGNDAIRLAGLHGQTTDPVDGRYYIYSINLAQDKAQMLGYLEESGKHTIGYAGNGRALHNISGENDIFAGGLRTYAESSDLSVRYPFVTGDTLGILLSSTGATKNQPVQDILTGAVDVSSGTVAASYTAYLSESSGSVSGTSIAETIPALYNPSATCGSSNGGGFVSTPTIGLCAIGSSTGAVNSGGSWVWTCSASNGSRTICGGSVSVVSPAACGTATATPTSTTPGSSLCASGNPSAVEMSGSNWTWNCLDGGGSILASCSVGILVSGACSTPPENAIFSNGSGSYILSNAPYGTSLTASYNASPSTNTCQYACGDGFGWSGTNCVALPTIVCAGTSVTSNYSSTPGASWCKFPYAGSMQTLTVNSGAGNVTVNAWGGGGGGGSQPGGGAAAGNLSISLSTGNTLKLYTGGGGLSSGGGGATYILLNSTPQLVVGGGGGGGGAYPGGPGLVTTAGGNGTGSYPGSGGSGGNGGSTGHSPGSGGAPYGDGAGGGGISSVGATVPATSGIVTYSNSNWGVPGAIGGGTGPGGAGGGSGYGACGGYGGGGGGQNGGGGGGGYSGGGGGGGASIQYMGGVCNDCAGGGGGGSYVITGGTLYGGSGQTPGNNGSINRPAGIGTGGAASAPGGNGFVYVFW